MLMRMKVGSVDVTPGTASARHGSDISFLASIAVAAVVFAALYMASRSVWPCALFHLSWNIFNPMLLGNVYSEHPGLFGGEVWISNGEGVFGLVLNGLLAVWFFRRWTRAPAAQPVPAVQVQGA
jgi:membrane protease YdiL (CAAX protease family)